MYVISQKEFTFEFTWQVRHLVDFLSGLQNWEGDARAIHVSQFININKMLDDSMDEWILVYLN